MRLSSGVVAPCSSPLLTSKTLTPSNQESGDAELDAEIASMHRQAPCECPEGREAQPASEKTSNFCVVEFGESTTSDSGKMMPWFVFWTCFLNIEQEVR